MTNAELLRCVSAWAQATYGRPVQSVTIQVRGLAVPVTLPLPAALSRAREGPAADEEHGRGLSPCVLDILRVLREVKKPLSRTRLLEEMARRGMDWNERTVAGYLARMVEDGTLRNDPNERPRGYRLEEDTP